MCFLLLPPRRTRRRKAKRRRSEANRQALSSFDALLLCFLNSLTNLSSHVLERGSLVNIISSFTCRHECPTQLFLPLYRDGCTFSETLLKRPLFVNWTCSRVLCYILFIYFELCFGFKRLFEFVILLSPLHKNASCRRKNLFFLFGLNYGCYNLVILIQPSSESEGTRSREKKKEKKSRNGGQEKKSKEDGEWSDDDLERKRRLLLEQLAEEHQ